MRCDRGPGGHGLRHGAGAGLDLGPGDYRGPDDVVRGADDLVRGPDDGQHVRWRCLRVRAVL